MANPYDVASAKFAIHYPTLSSNDAWNQFWIDVNGGYPGNLLWTFFKNAGAAGNDVPALIEDYFTNIYIP